MRKHDEPEPLHETPDRLRRALLPGMAALLALPLLRYAGLAPFAVAERLAAAAPDFSRVTTKAAAQRLVREGRLIEIALFPFELGGPDEPRNLSYITPEADLVRTLVIGTLSRFFEEDVIDRLKVEPHYAGDSIVPRRIAMTATHSGSEGHFGTTIEVW